MRDNPKYDDSFMNDPYNTITIREGEGTSITQNGRRIPEKWN